MSFPPLTEQQVRAGIAHSINKLGFAPTPENLLRTAEKIKEIRRGEHVEFREARRLALTRLDFFGDTREALKCALGKAFSMRRRPVPKKPRVRKTVRKPKPQEVPVIATVLEKHGQLAFAICRV